MDEFYKNSLDSLTQVARGAIYNASVVHRFGGAVVGTDYAPVTDLLAYRTPQVGAATALRIKAGGNAADSAGGSGARSVKLTGIDASGELITETLVTAGASASANSTTVFMRLFDAEVETSGTYGTQVAGSHVGNIYIENAAGTQDWALIPLNSFPAAHTNICPYTIPKHYTGYIENVSIYVEGAKFADVILLQRPNILQTSAPYSAIQRLQEWAGISNAVYENFPIPKRFPELTDIGLLAKVSQGTGTVMVQFDLLLLRNEF